MTITLTKDNYERSRSKLDLCGRGEMCKIMKYEDDVYSRGTKYVFNTDVTSGWFNTGLYHLTGREGCWRVTGLGVFLLIRKTDNPDGGCTLEFTDDLNPELA